MAKVKILVEGIHTRTSDNRLNIGSTTTLVQSNINIIVDPGAFINKGRLISALSDEGLETDDIDAVVFTHLHLDHVANVFLFPHAKIYHKFVCGTYPGQFQIIEKGYAERFDLINEPIADHVKIIETAGHSIDHISLIVNTDDGKIVIAGDAIARDEWADETKQPNPDLAYDVKKYNESRKKILEIADYIIPGHGGIFKVMK